MVARFVFGDAREWRYIVDSLATLIEEANFIMDPTGLRLRALDPSRIAMVDFMLPSTAFEEYECDEETRIGVSFDDLNKILKRGRADERLVFEVAEDRLRIKIIGKIERIFSLPLLDIGGEELKRTPKVSFTARARMLSDTLYDAIKDATLVSDSVKFSAKPEEFIIYAASDKGEINVRFTEEGGALIEYEVSEPAEAVYSLGYLNDILKKANKVSDMVLVEFATNNPLSLTFDVVGEGKLTYFLAPRMEM
ncbi:MAG: proliferating cell nuclear antigen (pcna) [Thermoprotei archaeon]|nr:MAG: proliferating cell nuclear antigen (pcna) [Thermoprotei archaeon]RLI92374.1 MAG: proliferating cell nuclear antigen (pcna) [Candidatus Altiarchaeales archaeon]